jgi:hypothetical protein
MDDGAKQLLLTIVLIGHCRLPSVIVTMVIVHTLTGIISLGLPGKLGSTILLNCEETMSIVLTELQLACGVTPEQVTAELKRCLVRDGGANLIVDGNIAPALASAVAANHFGDIPHSLSFNRKLGLAIYTAA